MKLVDRDKAILVWESNRYKDILSIQNQDLRSPGYPPSGGCPTCSLIDALCEEYYSLTDINRKDEILEQLKLFEINAYRLLKLYESFGHIDLKPDNIDNISHFLYSNKYTNEELIRMRTIDSLINDVRIESTRWCATCGARKPDVLNDTEEILLIKDVDQVMAIDDIDKVKLHKMLRG